MLPRPSLLLPSVAGTLVLLAAPGGTAVAAPAGAGARATPRIVGGTALSSTTKAPWTVAIQTDFGRDRVGGCSGTVLDATHVLTAAHCVVTDGGGRAAPGRVGVVAGSANVATPAGIASGVPAQVAAVRVHPRHRAGGFVDDVAVLSLTAPLDLTTPRVRALPMASAGTFLQPGRLIHVAGFGVTAAGRSDYGRLRTANVRTAIGGDACSTTAPGAFLCTLGTRKGACSGDSGGTATIGPAGARRLIGVTDVADSRCLGLNLFANVAAPEIRSFIDAALLEQDVTAAQTPKAPRGGRTVRLEGTARVGGTVSCRRGTWSKGTTFRYAFLLDRGTRQRNRGFRSRRTYTLRAEDRGWRVFCAVEATSAGGRGIAVGRNDRPVG